MVRILNVMDDLSNFKSLGDGKYESGYWVAPDLNCSIIRLFRRVGVSFLGRKILAERIEDFEDEKGSRKVKIFIFKDDKSQHGKSRPPRFRPNGCVYSDE
ncbi:hypothetical protein Ms3S1_p20330 (plasmid) [Methylosinus sp. 3S-1]